METVILAHLREHRRVAEQMIETMTPVIAHAAERTLECFRRGGKLLAMGNGGSAADAQHFVAEMVGRYRRERRGLPAIALSADPSVVTALSNDYGYAEIFARQVEAHGRPGDIVWGMSTSGNSENVCRAFETARSIGAFTVALGGGTGGRMKDLADLAIVVPSAETPRIQEAHITIIHVVCDLVEDAIAGDSGR